MRMLSPEGTSLPVFGPSWILRNPIKSQVLNRSQPLAGVLCEIPDGVLLTQGFDLLG